MAGAFQRGNPVIREKLYGMVAMTAPTSGLRWKMTPIAFSEVRPAERHTGELMEMRESVMPTCLGYPVEIIKPTTYRENRIEFGVFQ